MIEMKINALCVKPSRLLGRFSVCNSLLRTCGEFSAFYFEDLTYIARMKYINKKIGKMKKVR